MHEECVQRLSAMQEQIDRLLEAIATSAAAPAPAAPTTDQGTVTAPAGGSGGEAFSSRRRFLGAGAAALGGLAVGQLQAPTSAQAATGASMVLGRTNTAGATTTLNGPSGAPALTLIGGADDRGYNQQALEAQGNVRIRQSPSGTALLVDGGEGWEYSSGVAESGSGAQPDTTMIVRGATYYSSSETHWSSSEGEIGAMGLEVTAKANTAISAYASNGTSTSESDENPTPTTAVVPGTALQVGADEGGTGILVQSGGITVAKGTVVLAEGLEARNGGVVVAGGSAQDNVTSTATGTGRAVYGLATGVSSTAGAVTGEHRGKGAGVWGHQAAPAASAAEAAVVGYSVNGRGARFRGALAQVQLTPATAAAPPATGVAGDFFVDKTSRVWFCRSTSTTKADWQQVQVGPVVRTVKASSAYTAVVGDVVLADASGAALTITLPAPAPSAQVSVKKTDASTRVVTVKAAGTALIDGASSRDLTVRWQGVSLVSDGKDWFVL
ncbi:hypothetical protein CLV37_107235 [Kineococcus rhizosphaerae]|uniref:Uncharacterized protein n=2 Tax=Kineococcus rhizosphaerae TaxID=559628 RepID=A0A2T0R2U3_9ACTN|nr:hypothetical protein CLV37_107235 [Kineococcus rhizosphaerae]